MTGRTDETPRADERAEPEPDRPADEPETSPVPAIPPEIVGKTTDIVSRDWTGLGEGAAEDQRSAT